MECEPPVVADTSEVLTEVQMVAISEDAAPTYNVNLLELTSIDEESKKDLGGQSDGTGATDKSPPPDLPSDRSSEGHVTAVSETKTVQGKELEFENSHMGGSYGALKDIPNCEMTDLISLATDPPKSSDLHESVSVEGVNLDVVSVQQVFLSKTEDESGDKLLHLPVVVVPETQADISTKAGYSSTGIESC
jgi:hypothetical protein